MNDKTKKIEIVFSKNTIWKPHYTLKSIREGAKYCPRCKEELKPDSSFVPISAKCSARIDGMYCSHCDYLYVTNRA